MYSGIMSIHTAHLYAWMCLQWCLLSVLCIHKRLTSLSTLKSRISLFLKMGIESERTRRMTWRWCQKIKMIKNWQTGLKREGKRIVNSHCCVQKEWTNERRTFSNNNNNTRHLLCSSKALYYFVGCSITVSLFDWLLSLDPAGPFLFQFQHFGKWPIK